MYNLRRGNLKMNTENKKFIMPGWLTLSLMIAQIVLMVFLVVVSIIAMVTVGSAGGNPFMDWIKWLQLNPIYMFMLIVFPLIVLFLFNVFLLIKALNGQKEKIMNLSGMTEEQIREEARRQALEELKKEMASKGEEKE